MPVLLSQRTIRRRDPPAVASRSEGVTFQDMLKRAVRPVSREGADCAEVICALVDVLREQAKLAAKDDLHDIQAEAQPAVDCGTNRLVLERDKKIVAARLRALKADVRRRLGQHLRSAKQCWLRDRGGIAGLRLC